MLAPSLFLALVAVKRTLEWREFRGFGGENGAIDVVHFWPVLLTIVQILDHGFHLLAKTAPERYEPEARP